MIITTKKDTKDVLDQLEGRQSVFLFGCGACAEQCKTGGKAEVDELATELEAAGKKVLGSSIPPETCYRQRIKKDYRLIPEVAEAEAVLVLACGAGVKAVAEQCRDDQLVLPTLDTHFLATVERVGRFFEGCSLCGECVLGDTGAICPHTECPKALLNGPCGGVANGMCEVNPECECAWVRIYRRLEAQGRLDVMKKIAPPKDFSVSTRPRNRIVPH